MGEGAPLGQGLGVALAQAVGEALAREVPLAQKEAVGEAQAVGRPVALAQGVKEALTEGVPLALALAPALALAEGEALAQGVPLALALAAALALAEGPPLGLRVGRAEGVRRPEPDWAGEEEGLAERGAEGEGAADCVSRALRVAVTLGATKPAEGEGEGRREDRICGSGSTAATVKFSTFGRKVWGVRPAGMRQGSVVTTLSTLEKVRLVRTMSWKAVTFTGPSPVALARKPICTELRLRCRTLVPHVALAAP